MTRSPGAKVDSSHDQNGAFPKAVAASALSTRASTAPLSTVPQIFRRDFRWLVVEPTPLKNIISSKWESSPK